MRITRLPPAIPGFLLRSSCFATVLPLESVIVVGATALKVQEASGSSSNNYYNVAVGYDAGGNVTTGYYNTLLGVSAGQNLTTGTQNVFVGMDATSA